MCPEPRVIPAERAEARNWEAFPYFAASYAPTLEDAELGSGEDSPISANLSTPEEDAKRLASVDQQVYTKLQEAEREAQDIARRAYEEGFASGESEGRAFGESQYRVFFQRLETYLEELSAATQLVKQASQEELLALTLTFSEYLAGQQLERSPASIQTLLEAILVAHPLPAAVEGRPAATVFLNPKDLEQLGDRFVDRPGILLQVDAELSRGSIRFETAEGVVDASLERRRERLLELVHRFREQEQP